MSSISIQGLTKRFDGNVVIDALDLAVAEGEFLTLLGPSGCGKTTTLRCIAGLEEPDEGRIEIGAEVVVDTTRDLVVPPNRRGIGMVFQSYALWPHMDVAANVGYPLRVRRAPAREIGPRVSEALALVGLARFERRAVSSLSGGQQQRVALARALVARPRLLLLDEPLSNLDANLRVQMRQELRRIHRETRTTTVYVTHDQTEAATLSDRIVLLRDGRPEHVGSPHDVFTRPVSRWAAEFLGFENLIDATLAGTSSAPRVRPERWPIDLACLAPTALAAGSRVTLALRSRAIAVADDPARPNAFDAVVVDVIFRGDLTEYVLDAYGSRLVAPLAERDRPDGQRFRTGERLRLAVAPHDAVILAADVAPARRSSVVN